MLSLSRPLYLDFRLTVNAPQLREHPKTSAEKPQPSQPASLPTPSVPRMNSMTPESMEPVPTFHLPKTPQPTRTDLDDGGFIYGLFDMDDNTTTPHSGPAESSMIASTQGVPSDMGSPGPRPPLGVKRKADALEGRVGNLKRHSWVNSPFVLSSRFHE